MTFHVDQTKFNDQMGALHDALIGAGRMGDAANVVRDESRWLFLRQFMRFTPPKSLSQGRKAVTRDIRRAMTPLTPDAFTSPKLKERIRKVLAESADKEASVSAILEHAGQWKAWKVKPFAPELHVRSRDKRGRVRGSKRTFVLETAKLKRYIREVQSHVGRMRSGWAPALRSVGGEKFIPTWVARHSDNPGYVVNDLANGIAPSITVANHAPGIRQLAHSVRGALASRARAIRTKVKFLLTSYGRDVAQGVRVTPKTVLSNN